LHPGIDIATSMGTPIFATADGEVVQSGWSGGYGNIVQINHGNGIETIYGHNSRVIVNAGQYVKKGQIICYSGNTGRSTGPHLHYEIRVNGTAVDPIRFLVL
jgi:murein DD-endopeptidase MepM/ murein hydrolase activator NlpD